ncbi:sensor histidine kinase [Baia soyae]|uniref:histidine kinase n=1 Tax=Baia soyae TaxID=1544746 RepID=A0A4R2S1W7_9BACL|nr:ATP-binding protein [Baia soyae]TCP70225.1 histidine kinase/DNA gyrase B/HSP90-like ATPase [Baia soyae]
MLILWILLWVIGTLLLTADFRSPSARWASATTFLFGAAGMSLVIGEQIKPLFDNNSNIFQYFLLVENITWFISEYLAPYAFIFFALIYSKLIPSKYIRVLKFFLLIPIIGMLVFYPVHPTFIIPYHITTFWVVPYILVGIVLLIWSYILEKNPFIKKSRLSTCLGFVPFMIIVLITCYFLRIMGIEESWRYNYWIVVFLFSVCITSLFRFGFVGARLRVQRQSLNYSIQRILAETSVMNHGVKNDLGKIKLYCEKIKEYAITTNQRELQESIDVVLQAHEKMQKNMMRIQQQTKDQKLYIEEYRVMDMVERSLHQLGIKLKSTDIEVVRKCSDHSLTMLCDHVLIEEVIYNIILNAIEAMPCGGKLTIQVDEIRKDILLIIKDTGIGISKEHFPRILEPFFSTKSNPRENFGLGLSFCYNVINKHGGKIDFYSKNKKGTTVYLAFPKKKGRVLWKRFVS